MNLNHFTLALASVCSLTQAVSGQWSAPTRVASVNSPSLEYGPSLTSDGLTLYFTSTRLTGGDIYRATRSSRYGTFGSPVPVTELNSTWEDWVSCSRLDDLEIFFTSPRPGGGGGGYYDLWRADRTSTSVPFNAPVPMVELNTAADEYAVSLTGDGLQIYFASDRAGGAGGYDIWTATRATWFAPFGPPTPVTELNTLALDRDPRISADNLVMVFVSDRASPQGYQDLWMASRLDTAAPFGNVIRLSAVSSPELDFNPGWSTFHDELFFSSARPGGLGGWEIYSTRFTGLLGLGIASQTSGQDLLFSDPSSAGSLYLAAASLGSSPGIPIDTRVLPLNADLVFQLTIGGLHPILTGYAGVLDQDGVAPGRISFAGFPGLMGMRLFSAFLVLDPTAPSGIKTISNPHATLVQ